MKPSRYRFKTKVGKGRGKKAKHASRHAYVMRVPRIVWMAPLVLLLGLGLVGSTFLGEEIRTSRLQAEYFARETKDISFVMEEGASPIFHTPPTGPYNQRLGYSYLPFFIKTLEADDYVVTAQMRGSPAYEKLLGDGLYPIYRPKIVAGLQMKDRSGQALYNASFPSNVFADYDSIPKVLVDTLLFIEDRDLLNESEPTRNPAIEWDRFLYAALGQLLKVVVPDLNLGGGSTLATQIEKFRFSTGGQTSGIKDKLRQIASASARVYMDGPDTREARRRIVLEYLNSTPLSARQGFGEINSIGDGMWAWFGLTIPEITEALNLPEDAPVALLKKATVYREALGLILAQRRPSYYLLTDRRALDELTDQTLDNLAAAGKISSTLREAARASTFRFLPQAPAPAAMDFLANKATNAMRTHLLKMLALRNLYELDRVDLEATSTLDQKVQQGLVDFLKKMSDPAHVGAIGMYGFRLLGADNDLSKINWSVLLYEKTDAGNLLRVQADNIDAPLDMNEGGKLDLGSTAKLRTLVTYLEIVGELYRRYAGLSPDDLKELTEEAPDVLTSWATTWLATHPDATLDDMLQAGMDRKYSGSSGEVFFTGGGAHTFVNFEKEEDYKNFDLREALRDSVNLVFIRLMRDIVNYTIAQGQQTKQELLSDPDHPARKAYLERYADREGTTFLNRYISDYEGLKRQALIDKAMGRAHKGATARAILFRSVDPQATFGEFCAYMKKAVEASLDKDRLRQLYDDYPPDRYSLADKGYITGLNPLELWMVAYKIAHPDATRKKMIAVSKSVRIESYAWLFHAKKKGAQDTRIRILLELDAFARIQQRWARVGYPFDKLVPSFATAIGSSADRPGALAELVGILLNDGVRKPMLRFEKLHFAQDTPFDSILMPSGLKAERVLDPAVARVARAAMTEVVENGTARRLRGAYIDSDGKPLVIGGKTGTGDHRYDEYGAGHRLISSRVVNRTGTIMFFIGDRFFGTVTAHVAGEEAGKYKFTSALSAQMLKSLAPVLQPLIAAPKPPSPDIYGPPMPPETAGTESLSAPRPPPVLDAPKPKAKTTPRPPPVTSQDMMMDILPE